MSNQLGFPVELPLSFHTAVTRVREALKPEGEFGLVHAGPVGAGIAGFALYQWLPPLGPSWWVDLVERTGPPETQIGSSLPSFALAFALAAAAILGERRLRPEPA